MLNYVYEQEILKQDIRDEIRKLENIRNFTPNQLVKYRDADMEERQRRMQQSDGVTALESLDQHYRYFNHQLLNALKESAYRATLKPTILMHYFNSK